MEKILKYSNRKLYSTALSKYVKLDYIVDLVKLGSKFEVRAHKSGTDLTNAVLRAAMVKMKREMTTEELVRMIRE